MFSKKIINIAFLLCFGSFLLNSCAPFNSVDAKKFPPDPKLRVKKNMEEGRGFRLMDKIKTTGSRNFEFASSNELWRASLDAIDFMPLASVNYSGGIIITDWYSNNQNTENIKITIRFLTNEIRSDALDIKVFRKTCNELNKCNKEVYIDEPNAIGILSSDFRTFGFDYTDKCPGRECPKVSGDKMVYPNGVELRIFDHFTKSL